MPSALAFIGGGLLEGVGKGLVESGKEKRERALADLAHQRNLERDKAKLEGRQGLLKTEIKGRETAATALVGVNTTKAETLFNRQVERDKTGAGVNEAAARKLEENRAEAQRQLVIANKNAASTAAEVQRLINKKESGARIEAAKQLAKVAEEAKKLANERAIEASRRNVTAQQNAASAGREAARLAKDTENKRKVEAATELNRRKAPPDLSQAEKRAWDIEVEAATRPVIVDGFPTGETTVDMGAVARGMERRGHTEAAASAREQAQSTETDDLSQRAEESAQKTVDEIESVFSFGEFDKYGGSKELAKQYFIRLFIFNEIGGTPPTLPGSPQGTPPTRETGAPGGRGATPELAVGDNPYVGSEPPQSHPKARQGLGDFWYIPDPANPGKFSAVQKTGAR